jgi:hypothetical protein
MLLARPDEHTQSCMMVVTNCGGVVYTRRRQEGANASEHTILIGMVLL